MATKFAVRAPLGRTGMNLGVLMDGERSSRLDVDSRGLNYGDGLFETILIEQGQPVWWGEHFARLRRGALALGMQLPDADGLLGEVCALAQGHERAVLKLCLVRDGAGRGYAPAPGARSQRILSLHLAPLLPMAQYRDGIEVRWCSMQWSQQPRLAGIKHLNRLENVLARAECEQAGVAEGLVCDSSGQVVSATGANLFVQRRGKLFTPPLRESGIAGVCRDWILSRMHVEIRELYPVEILRAEAVFLSNCVRGIMPVKRIEQRQFRVTPLLAGLMAQLWHEVPALTPLPETVV